MKFVSFPLNSEPLPLCFLPSARNAHLPPLPKNFFSYSLSQRSEVHRPHLAHHLLLSIKFCWNLVVLICLRAVPDYFCATVAKLGTCNRDHTAHRTSDIYLCGL